MGFERLRFELRVELATEIPRVVCNLAYFNVNAVRCLSGQLQSVAGENRLEFAVGIIAGPVPFADLFGPGSGAGEASLRKPAGICAQAHRPAELIDAFQLAQLVDHAVRCRRIELRRMGLLESAYVARVLD